MIFFPKIFRARGNATLPPPIRRRLPPRPRLEKPEYLLAGIRAVFTLEPFLVFMTLLVLHEGVALMEDGGAVAALHLRGSVRVLVVQMDA